MKKSAIALACILVIIGSINIYHHFQSAGAMHQGEIIAHRAGTRYWPENTVYGIEQSIATGIDGVEFDVHLTRDGHMVIIHDETVDRTTDGSGRVDAYTLFELRELDAGYDWQNAAGEHPYRGRGFKVPIVEEVLDLAPFIKVILDLKDYTPETLTWLCGQIQSRGLQDQVWLARLGFTDLPQVRQTCGPDISTNLELSELEAYGPQWTQVVSRPYVLISKNFATPEVLPTIMRQASAHDIPIYISGVDAANLAQDLLEQDIAGIMTEEPVVIMQELGLLKDTSIISQ